ncbi:cobalt ECF transporter T component CbiQ [Desulfobaculum bizertense]|uniref:cobalt ECF transporter T component CbiQ n=1 Tax=Desulfobaculum bizertense TaxID=376490 RepID=UPI001F1817A0|nr:cobalt ECF transporter T component CbiQ [Desulfobaculum bizertense]UIJ39136.1 cobalt ECF transporter T component CbiQ [Desulfobaculum bizertense]
MIDESFSLGHSPIHRLDPRGRILAACAFSCVVALLHIRLPLYIALACGLCLLLCARLSLSSVLRRLLLVNIFVLVLWLFLPFSVPGTPVFQVWEFTASLEGIQLATDISIKSNAIIMAFIALISTIPIPDLGHALLRLKVPQKLSLLLLFAYRHIFLIAEEYQRLHAAMKIRGFVPRTNLHTYRAYASLLGMVIIRSWERSERVYNAMLCRGFRGTFRSLNGFRFTLSDRVFVFFMLALSCALAAGEYTLS